MKVIESSKNPLLKKIKNLSKKTYREKEGQFFIEGLRFIQDAIVEKILFVEVVISEYFYNDPTNKSIINYLDKNTNLILVNDSLFSNISSTASPQGIIAVINNSSIQSTHTIKDGDFYIIIDSLQDPGNLGAIIRTSAAANVSAIFLGPGCVDLFNPKVLRATMGAIFKLPIIQLSSLTTIINNLKENSYSITATTPTSLIPYYSTDLTKNIALIVGNEANGISDDILALADTNITIPMFNNVESLNVSTATSIIIYEMLRQKSTQ